MPAALKRRALLIENWKWLGLLVLIVIGVLGDRLSVMALNLGLKPRVVKLAPKIDADTIAPALRPFGLLIMALLWGVGIGWLGLPVKILDVLVKAIQFVAAFSVVWGAYRLVDVVGAMLQERARDTDTRFDDLLIPLFRKSLKIFIAAFGLIFIADVTGAPVGTLLAGVGLGGLAVALAAQETVANIFGSVTILVDRPFHVGDWIIMGDVEGTVEEVGFRSTRVRTFYNSLITIPNSNMIKAVVDNMGERRYRRWKTMLSIAYETPPDKIEAFCEGIREIVRIHPYTRKDYFHVYLNQFAGSSLDILIYVFHETPDWAVELRERHRLAMDILRLAERLGVEFAYPTQKLLMQHGEGLDYKAPTPGARLDDAANVNDALALGRREAHTIVESILGSNPTQPPPVASYVPEIESRGESGDDGDGS